MQIPERTVHNWIKREDWPAPSGEIRADGCGRPAPAWTVSELPEFITLKGKQVAIRGVVQRALLDRSVQDASALLPSPVAAVPQAVAAAIPASSLALPDAGQAEGLMVIRGLHRKAMTSDKLTDKDRDYRDAALVLCNALEEALGQTGLSVSRCCVALSARILAGNVLPALTKAEKTTYLKPRKGGQTVSSLASRLSKLYSAYMQGIRCGNPSAFLTPGKREKPGFNPVWVDSLLRFYCHPHRPSVKQAWAAQVPHLEELGIEPPSYSTAVKIIEDLPVPVKLRARATGSALKSLLAYVGRDVSMFKSNDIWVCDGHTFKAKVLHPIHGQPFQPEITLVMDWVSRKIVGWSIGLSESVIAVSDAFRHAQLQTRARPLIYYTDNGGGQSNKVFDHEIHGVLVRQGIAHQTGIPGNPQGRGVIERLWQTTTIPLAQTYPSCIWRGADQNTVRKTLQRLNRKDTEARGAPTWMQFLDDVAAMVHRYNYEHRHSSLGGKVPEAMYQERIDTGSIVFGPDDEEISELWMPQVSRRPHRGLIKLFGNAYFHASLPHVLAEREKVNVRYDIHDAGKVWVYREDGSFICEAIWNGHAREAFPVSQVEEARQKRVQRMVKRGEAIIAEAQAELQPTFDALPVIEPEILELGTLIQLPKRSDEVAIENDEQELSHQATWEAMFAGFEQLNEEEDDEEGDPMTRIGAG
jgi:putative transposase